MSKFTNSGKQSNLGQRATKILLGKTFLPDTSWPIVLHIENECEMKMNMKDLCLKGDAMEGYS